MTSSTDSSNMVMRALSLLEGTEYHLRRHLQLPESEDAPEDDPNMTLTDDGVFGDTDGSAGSQSRGRAILTILYLCVLALCFVIPVFYYFRLHCSEESARREMEVDFTTALEQSTQQQQREESRAARRKYMDERRARIVQLFGPVRMILKEDNFPHLVPSGIRKTGEGRGELEDGIIHSCCCGESMTTIPTGGEENCDETVTMASDGDGPLSPYTSDDDDCGADHDYDGNDSDSETRDNNNETGAISTREQEDKDSDAMEQGISNRVHYSSDHHDLEIHNESKMEQTDAGFIQEGEEKDPDGEDDEEEEVVMVRLPKPGLQLGSDSLFIEPTKKLESVQDQELRVCQGMCSICLSNYKVGSDVVWSSNEACDHHFHASCIERWLMKQREGPLCPCCRRDFIVDPFDLLEEGNNNEDGANGPMLHWDPSTLEDDFSGLSGFDSEPVGMVSEETIRENDSNDDNNNGTTVATTDPNSDNTANTNDVEANRSRVQNDSNEVRAEVEADTNSNTGGQNYQSDRSF